MKRSVLISTLILLFVSCKNAQRQHDDNTPKALEEKSSVEIISKRSSNDLVESLYDELLDKTPELKELELKIEGLNENKSDSLEAFNKYNNKTQSYYSSANFYIEQIKDFVFKK